MNWPCWQLNYNLDLEEKSIIIIFINISVNKILNYVFQYTCEWHAVYIGHYGARRQILYYDARMDLVV